MSSSYDLALCKALRDVIKTSNPAQDDREREIQDILYLFVTRSIAYIPYLDLVIDHVMNLEEIDEDLRKGLALKLSEAGILKAKLIELLV